MFDFQLSPHRWAATYLLLFAGMLLLFAGGLLARAAMTGCSAAPPAATASQYDLPRDATDVEVISNDYATTWLTFKWRGRKFLLVQRVGASGNVVSYAFTELSPDQLILVPTDSQ